MLLLAGAQILGGDVHDAVGVDIEGDLDLRNAAAGRGDAVQVEAAQALVVSGHLALALEDIDLNGGLVVRGGGEDLALAGGDGGVALDELGAHAAQGLDAQRQRGHVQQQDALHVAAQNAALDGSADGHTLIGVDALEAFLAHQGLDHILHGGDAAGAAHQQDLADVAGIQAGVGQSLAHGAGGLFHQVVGQLVELGPGQGHIQMLGAGGVGGDIGQIDVGGGHAGELHLGLLGGLAQALHGHLVVGEVDALGLAELIHQVLGDAGVEVIAAQAVVAGGCQNFDDAVADLQHGDVEGAAAQVVDHDLLVALLVQTVGQSGRGGLVDDALDIKAGDLAGVLGGLTLSVGEVSGDGDDRLGDGLAQIGLGVRLQLLQHHGGDLLGGIGLVVDGDFVVGAHLALDGGDGAVGVGDGLALGDLANHTLAGLGEGHHGRGGAGAFGVGNNGSLAAFHHGDAAIGGSQIDTDNLTHFFVLLYISDVYTIWIAEHCSALRN